MAQGVNFMIGTSKFQKLQGAVEPYLSVQAVGPVSIGIILGIAGGVLTLFLLDNKRLPAGLVVVAGGVILGAILGTHEGLSEVTFGFQLPALLPFGWASGVDITFVLFALVFPQIPMTLGNAVVANADLSREYFKDDALRVTPRALCISMALANFFAFTLGGMPLCHGAGGLAAHYRFGARSAGSNLMIGAIFVFLAVFLGMSALYVLYLVPMAVLGVLLFFSGSQLALMVMEVGGKKDYFVALSIVGITLATNLAAGFIAGVLMALCLKSEKLSV
jgi:SulP family sulfate permease